MISKEPVLTKMIKNNPLDYTYLLLYLPTKFTQARLK